MKKKEFSNTPKVSEVKVSQLDNNDLFLIINVEDKYRIGCNGQWLTKQVFNTPEEAQEYINSKPWDLIFNVAGMIADFSIREREKTISTDK